VIPARARVPRLLLGLVAALALLLPAAPIAAAADVTFGAPQYSAVYNDAITFTIPYATSVPLDRVEIRMEFPDSLGPFISVVNAPSGGSGELTYTLALAGSGHLVPNTTFDVTWAAFPDASGDPVLSKPLTVHYTDTTHEWKSLKGDLVTVHWYDGSEAFAKRALKIGDDAVRDTAKLLGVTETDPIDFFIYGDETSFRDALGPGTRENVGGQAHSDIRTLFALIEPSAIDDPWVGVVVPHELTHLVFDTAVDNPYRFPPRWLNEGLAVYLSEGYTRSDQRLVEGAVSDKNLLPLTALTGQFPTDFQATYLAYAESTSAIDFIVRTYGRDAMLGLVASYRDGLTDDEAFTRATGQDLAGFQAAWLKDLGADEPTQFGPQPNPAGPVPPGWDQPLPTTGPGGTSGPGAPEATGVPSASGVPADAGGSATGMDTTVVLVIVIVIVFTILFVGLILLRRRPEPS
jgi:hypothetical protein